MSKSKKPMHIPPRMPRQTFSFEIPPSKHKTTVHIEVEIYQGEGPAMVQMEPLLGDGLVPPDKLRWRGYEYPLTPLEWKLLDELLSTDNKRRREKEIIATLWPNSLRPGDQEKLKK